MSIQNLLCFCEYAPLRCIARILICFGLPTLVACGPAASHKPGQADSSGVVPIVEPHTSVMRTAQVDPLPGADAAPEKLIVMTWNVEWMFDHDQSDNRSELAREQSAPSAAYWQWKVDAVADAIAKCDATIVALQEIEGAQTLRDIAAALRQRHKKSYRSAFIEGSDSFTEQDVGILQRSGLMHYRRHEQSKAMFDSGIYYNVSKHLAAKFQWAAVQSPLTLMNVHFRAKAEAQSERTRQGRLARAWFEPEVVAGEDVIILGDINSEYAAGENADEMQYLLHGSLTGSDRAPMIDLLNHAPDDARRTHLILNKQFDRILVSPSLMIDDPNGPDWVFSSIAVRPELALRGSHDGEAHWRERLTMSTAELDVSDHAPVIATFELR